MKGFHVSQIPLVIFLIGFLLHTSVTHAITLIIQIRDLHPKTNYSTHIPPMIVLELIQGTCPVGNTILFASRIILPHPTNYVVVPTVQNNYPSEQTECVYHTPFSQGDRHPSILRPSDHLPSLSQSMYPRHSQPSFGYEGSPPPAPYPTSTPPSPSPGVPYQWDDDRFNYDANANASVPMSQSHISQQMPFPSQVFRKDPMSPP